MRTILLCICLMLSSFVSAQSDRFYVVEFTDKYNTPYSLSSPLDFLSQRALERRNNQQIVLDSSDIPVNPAYLDSVKSVGFTVWTTSRWMNLAIVKTSDSTLIDSLNQFSFIKQSGRVSRQQGNKPGKGGEQVKDLAAKCKTSALPDYGMGFNQANMIGADFLHGLGLMGDSMVIAVLDAGFYKVDSLPVFDSLRINNRILGTWDFVNNEASVYEDHTHGMMVLSCMGANLPGQLVGTAPRASYWLLRSEEAASETISEEYFWLSAAEFADSAGADIINSSLGYTTFDEPQWDHSWQDLDGNTTVITRAADVAASKGLLVINSAGNSGSSSWNFIGAPADGDSVLTIGAVDPGSNYASFSSNGPTIDGRVKPDVAAQGQQTIVAHPAGGLAAANGTSFSSPVLAGAAACLWQGKKSATNMEVLHSIVKSAHQYSHPDTLLGYGIPDMASALYIMGVISLVPGESDAIGFPFPNPFRDQFAVDLATTGEQEINLSLIDMSGRIVLQKNFSLAGRTVCRQQFNTSGIAAGIYLLRVEMTGETLFRRVVKQ